MTRRATRRPRSRERYASHHTRPSVHLRSLTVIARRLILVAERIPAVHQGHVRLPRFAALEAARAQPVHALPFVLLVRTRAWAPLELVSRALRRWPDGRIPGAAALVPRQVSVSFRMEEKPLRLYRIAIMQPMSFHHEQALPVDRGQSVTRRWRRSQHRRSL